MVTTCDWRLLQPTLFRDLDCISDRIRDQRIKGDLLFGCGGITTEAFDQAIGKNAVSEIGIFMGELVHFARRQRCPPFSLDEKVLLDIRPDWCCPYTHAPGMAGIEKTHRETGLRLTKIFINHVHGDACISHYRRSELLRQQVAILSISRAVTGKKEENRIFFSRISGHIENGSQYI